MAKDKKVVSLDERRRARPASGAGGAHGAGESTRGDTQQSTGHERAAADIGAEQADADPVPGRLIWLYCPTCRTLEYTELAMAGGRVHNVCGTHVQEAPVELDLRAEGSIAQINLERLKILESLLAGQRQRYEEYQRRLNLAAGRKLAPYPAGEGGAAELPVAGVDAFGLLVSRFFHEPDAHFPELAAQPGEPPQQSPQSAPQGAHQATAPGAPHEGPPRPQDD
jgi:hypothetical protein